MIIIGNKKNGDVGEYVGRPSILGNPFEMESERERDAVIYKYEKWIREKIKTDEKILAEITRLKKIYEENGNLTLVCWCSPKKCHAEIIKKIILEMCNVKEYSNIVNI